MKKALGLLVFAVALCCNQLSAQNLPNYSAIKLEVKEDYNAAADDAARQASEYLLGTPIVREDVNRLKSIQYLMKWMEGSPKYNFTLDDAAKPFLGDTQILAVYMAAMVNVKLAQPDLKTDKQVAIAAVKQTLNYLSRFNIKAKGKIKDLVAADKNGTLEQELYKTKS